MIHPAQASFAWPESSQTPTFLKLDAAGHEWWRAFCLHQVGHCQERAGQDEEHAQEWVEIAQNWAKGVKLHTDWLEGKR